MIVVGVAVLAGGRVLAARRVGGGWEFPGGKVEPGESSAQAAVREMVEELGCQVEVSGWLSPIVAIGPGLELRVATARLVEGEPVPRPGVHEAVLWVPLGALWSVDWLPADRPFVEELGV